VNSFEYGGESAVKAKETWTAMSARPEALKGMGGAARRGLSLALGPVIGFSEKLSYFDRKRSYALKKLRYR
jgi:hypothetical protein